MQAEVRAAVAAIALSHNLGKDVSGIFCFGGGWTLIDIAIRGNRVDGYDYTNSCHIDGNIPDLYHYGQSGHVEFKRLNGSKYEGYDYGSGSHFEIKVQGQEAEVYDYGVGKYFQFGL